ncbi:putative alkylated DNA repair protein [Golden Marseillevirus]|uniref:alkylated DNA repair n=1 Tax=Golden Marseillevirus TaxID=1720526 RepID=UPI000877ABB6|nr:alkylated DNA repair [Golden Marseillevirus]ALX27545.1 putative alkylated DNA repair protein [Golden Marseillevirus]
MAEPPIKHYKRYLYGRRKKVIRLLDATEFLSPEETAIRMRGMVIPVPRLQIGFGAEEGLAYGFTGVQVNAKKWPLPIESLATRIRDFLESEDVLPKESPPPNYVLVNKYVNGNHYIGWHSDKEKRLDTKYPIVSLSLGAARDFCLRLIKDQKHKRNILLENGDLVVMLPGMQQTWQHCIPKRKNVTETRYNLTFRWVI